MTEQLVCACCGCCACDFCWYQKDQKGKCRLCGNRVRESKGKHEKDQEELLEINARQSKAVDQYLSTYWLMS